MSEQTFVLPIHLKTYPGRCKPLTAWVIEQVRACVCIAMAVMNQDRIFVDDQPVVLHKGGDYTTIRLLVKEKKPLTKLQLEALQELCSVARKLQNAELQPYVIALMSTIADSLNLH